jgi:hypothetical protein
VNILLQVSGMAGGHGGLAARVLDSAAHGAGDTHCDARAIGLLRGRRLLMHGERHRCRNDHAADDGSRQQRCPAFARGQRFSGRGLAGVGR